MRQRKSRASTAKRARSTETRETRKRGATGKSKPKKARKSPVGRKASTSQAKPKKKKPSSQSQTKRKQVSRSGAKHAGRKEKTTNKGKTGSKRGGKAANSKVVRTVKSRQGAPTARRKPARVAPNALPPKPRKRAPVGKSWVFEPEGQKWTAVKLESSSWQSAPKGKTGGSRKGRPGVLGAVRLTSGPGRGEKRAELSAIKGWIAKRKHVEWWRNRNGSYSALVTFYGETAWAQLERAFRKLPVGGCYAAIRFFHIATSLEQVQKSGGSSPLLLKPLTGVQALLVPRSTPTTRVTGDDSRLPYLLRFVYDNNAEKVYMRRCGMAVFWGSGKGEP